MELKTGQSTENTLFPGSCGILLIVSGPSGAGKSTVLQEVMQGRDDIFFSVSATTRPPRPGEIDGVHYHFIDKNAFEALIEDDALLEYAEFAGNLYGTPRSFVNERLQKGQIVVLDIETQGALQVMKRCPDAVTAFIATSRMAETERRLRARGTETEERIKARLEAAAQECRRMKQYQYLVYNDVLDEAAQDLRAILRAEQCRRRPAMIDC